MSGDGVTAVVYCRISQDRAGDELGVRRQREDCEKLAAARGWSVVEVVVDDDLSAYGGRPRPGYEHVLELVREGRVGAVVAWHPDRLHRSPRELEDFIDAVEVAHVSVATVQAGELDLGTASGRMTARVVGAMARHESEQKSERIRRQREQMALEGRPNGGGRRAFGYEPGGLVLVEDEALLIREAVDRYLAGASLRSIANDWNARGIASSSGGKWSIPSLKFMLGGPRIAGLRVHRGEVVGQGTWPAIITREEHDALRARLGNPREHKRGRPATSLLGGLIVCGRCGHTMHASRYPNGARRYMCARSPGRDACGGVAIIAEPTEDLIVEVVLSEFDSPDLARAVQEPDHTAARVDVGALEERLTDLADLFGAGEISRSEWMRARDVVERKLLAARHERDAVERAAATRPFTKPGALRAAWPDLTDEERRQILGAVIKTIDIAPASAPGRFRSDRISVRWGDVAASTAGAGGEPVWDHSGLRTDG